MDRTLASEAKDDGSNPSGGISACPRNKSEKGHGPRDVPRIAEPIVCTLVVVAQATATLALVVQRIEQSFPKA